MSNNVLDRIADLELVPKIIVFSILAVVSLWLFNFLFGLIEFIIPFSSTIGFIVSIGIIVYLGLKIFKRHL